ncbi:hypothetical protein E4T43_07446 [Aureobasidium subglaciale]|nr:hypothetical protein E4T43_07446 [Aureobasidium subglaciale]
MIAISRAAQHLNLFPSSIVPHDSKMGTRNLTIVYYKGRYRIAQYGRWDGCPDGQGLTILHFLKDPANIAKLQEVLDDSERRIIIPSDEELLAYFEELQRKQLQARSFLPLPPIESLSRDTGAKIL